jgi:hypothetical protein
MKSKAWLNEWNLICSALYKDGVTVYEELSKTMQRFVHFKYEKIQYRKKEDDLNILNSA